MVPGLGSLMWRSVHDDPVKAQRVLGEVPVGMVSCRSPAKSIAMALPAEHQTPGGPQGGITVIGVYTARCSRAGMIAVLSSGRLLLDSYISLRSTKLD